MIKVCGMRDAENIRDVAALGADIIGLIFYPKSPRYVGENPTNLPSGIDYAGVFVNEEPDLILQNTKNCKLSYVQLHGNESATYIRNLRRRLPSGVKIIKSISIQKDSDIKEWQSYNALADILLFDTQCTGYGGSGVKFDWHILDQYDGTIPFLLSGGIGPEDAERIMDFAHPLCIGIDVNSRFENVPAVKDKELIGDFIRKINKFDYMLEDR